MAKGDLVRAEGTCGICKTREGKWSYLHPLRGRMAVCDPCAIMTCSTKHFEREGDDPLGIAELMTRTQEAEEVERGDKIFISYINADCSSCGRRRLQLFVDRNDAARMIECEKCLKVWPLT